MIGKTLSHYRITEKLGEGGMGVVYCAEDTNLNRQIAIKVLPEMFSGDPERMARFEREAKLLASLNHPNIATIHGLEQADVKRFLVMELVEGETLAQKIAKGPLPVDETLDVCRQIAEGLEAAHEKGIIHRDLKPANVKITREGKVKILDFGLAKAFHREVAAADITQSPTISEAATRAGVILGTAAYMSPEQARGKVVDKTADIWAFGCVLFECLTGARPFLGETATDTIAKILQTDPNWNLLPDATPTSIRALLKRCLQKDRNRRQHDIADVRIELDESAATTAVAVQPPIHVRGIQALPWILAFLSTAILVVFVIMTGLRHPTPSGSVSRFSIPLGPVKSLLSTSLAISPDGTELAYTIDGRLFRRSMNDLAPVQLANTHQAINSCFFVNSEWIGFVSLGRLLKVIMATGASVPLCDAASFFGATGFVDDTIVFVSGAAKGLWRVSTQGGKHGVMLLPDFAKGERSYRWPAAFPDRRKLLIAMQTMENSSFDDARIMAYSPDGGSLSVVASGGTSPRYVRTSHVLFARSGNLHAIPFDVKSLSPTGPAKTVLKGILMDPLDGGACYDVSENGTLAYVPGGVISRNADVVWVDRNGNREPILRSEPVESQIRVSPDETRLAFCKGKDIWVYDMSLKSQVQITSDAAIDTNPVWSPDGRRIAFASSRAGDMDIYERSADGTGAETLLFASPLSVRPMSWSPDGKVLAFEDMGPATASDIKLLSFPGEGKASVRDFLVTTFNERQASFSPDGRCIAYISDESGEFEVYIQPADGTPQRRKVSTNGGTEPMWNPKGGELIFFKGRTAYSVSIKTSPELVTSAPHELFATAAMISANRFRNVDISRDGSRIAMMVPIEDPKELEMRVVLNWFDELRRLVPTGNK